MLLSHLHFGGVWLRTEQCRLLLRVRVIMDSGKETPAARQRIAVLEAQGVTLASAIYAGPVQKLQRPGAPAKIVCWPSGP